MESSYKELTLDNFMEVVLKEYSANKDKDKREYVMYTGSRGMESINHAIDKTIHVEFLRRFSNKFEEHERERLIQMLSSDDKEAFELAKLLIDERLKIK